MNKLNFVERLRCLVDSRFRRAYRSLRFLPVSDYDVVIDAGANRGSFTDAFLHLQNPRRLVLVEALPGLAEELRRMFKGQPNISVLPVALSDRSGTATFEVNEFDYSSSLLKIDPRNREWFGRSLNVAKTIEVPTLSLPDLLAQEKLDRVDLLKLDLQGAERLVLTGGRDVLGRIEVIFTEVLFEELYAGCWRFWDINEFLSDCGFKLSGLCNVVHSPSAELIQANAVFRNIAAGR